MLLLLEALPGAKLKAPVLIDLRLVREGWYGASLVEHGAAGGGATVGEAVASLAVDLVRIRRALDHLPQPTEDEAEQLRELDRLMA